MKGCSHRKQRSTKNEHPFRKGEQAMPISTVIGLLAALIGSTATLLGAWVYIRSQRPSKRELFHATITVTIIMAIILGLAVLISRATTISINGQQTLPLPPVSVPGFPNSGKPTPSPMLTPTPSPTQTPTLSPSPTQTPTPPPSPSPTSPPAPTPNPTQILSAHVATAGRPLGYT